MSLEVSILLAIFALFCNAFFVGAEFGLVSARRSSIEAMAVKGSKKAKKTLFAMENVSMMLAGAQLGITLFSLVLGAVAEPFIAHILEGPLYSLGLSVAMVHIIAILLALLVMTYFHVVIGEMVPKYLALARPESTAILLVPVLVMIVAWIRPVVNALNVLANKLLSIIKISTRDEIPSAFNRDEVAGFINESATEGLIDQEEMELLKGTLHLDDAQLNRIIIPYNSLVTIPENSTPLDVQNLAAKHGFSRYPVVSGNNYIGYVHLKDIIAIPKSQIDKPISSAVVRKLYKISEDQSLRSVLSDMQKASLHLGQVFSKNGLPLGLVALEDVLEELVGTIHDHSHS